LPGAYRRPYPLEAGSSDSFGRARPSLRTTRSSAPRFSREIAARIPGATLHVVPGAAHGYFMERPDVFNRLSLDFIARHSKGN